MIDRPFTDEERYARALLARFTPEKPFMAGQAVYDAMAKEPALTDLMDRVKLYPAFDDDIDWNRPEAWDYLRSVARGEPIMVLTSTSPSWVRDLWDIPQSVLKDGTPCQAFSATEMITVFENDPREVGRELFIRVEKAREQLHNMRYDDPLVDQLLGRGRLITDESHFLKMVEVEPERVSRRYGPYDADPHLKGRRRRFRKQRKI